MTNFRQGILESPFGRKLKAFARRTLPDRPRKILRYFLSTKHDSHSGLDIASGYEIMKEEASPELLKGWQDPRMPARQYEAFLPLLEKMYEGKPRQDFIALASAMKAADPNNGLIIEVGCGSGWNSEVLNYLLKRSIRYIGVDYSQAMAALGKRCYPKTPFVVGDATTLPFQNECCDILISGGVLMHLLGYEKAMEESHRVTRRWCIFHTVPVLHRRSTTLLRKKAYGSCVIEIIFNEEELRNLVEENGFTIRQTLNSIPYDLRQVLGEPTATKTYVCEINQA